MLHKFQDRRISTCVYITLASNNITCRQQQQLIIKRIFRANNIIILYACLHMMVACACMPAYCAHTDLRLHERQRSAECQCIHRICDAHGQNVWEWTFCVYINNIVVNDQQKRSILNLTGSAGFSGPVFSEPVKPNQRLSFLLECGQ